MHSAYDYWKTYGAYRAPRGPVARSCYASKSNFTRYHRQCEMCRTDETVATFKTNGRSLCLECYGFLKGKIK